MSEYQRPFRAYSTDLLVWLFFNTPSELENSDDLCQQISYELNERGEGDKVAV